MSTTKDDIRSWLERAKKNSASHVIIVCDTFDHEDYPVEVKQGEDVRAKYAEYNGRDMQRVMECYDLSLDIEKQLLEHRAFHF